jgi:hypothetical protein
LFLIVNDEAVKPRAEHSRSKMLALVAIGYHRIAVSRLRMNTVAWGLSL